MCVCVCICLTITLNLPLIHFWNLILCNKKIVQTNMWQVLFFLPFRFTLEHCPNLRKIFCIYISCLKEIYKNCYNNYKYSFNENNVSEYQENITLKVSIY